MMMLFPRLPSFICIRYISLRGESVDGIGGRAYFDVMMFEIFGYLLEMWIYESIRPISYPKIDRFHGSFGSKVGPLQEFSYFFKHDGDFCEGWM